MTLNEFILSRDAVGKRYQRVVAEMHESLVDLAAIDEVLANENVGYDGRADIRTFFNVPQNLGALAHPVYVPVNTAECWREEIKARRDDIIASINK